jgi:NADH-quinone oxidoreductase subunit C
MDVDALVASLQAEVPEAQVERVPSIDLQATCYVAREAMPAVARLLRDRPDLAFNFLAELTAVDFAPREPRYEIVYMVVSIVNRMRLRIKVRIPADDPHIATVTDGHPDPRRLLMPEDWQGYPLRKDYPVQIRMTPNASEALQVTEEEFRSNVMKDRLTRERS